VVRARYEDAVQRAERFRQHCETIRRNAAPPLASFDDLTDAAVEFNELFQSTRPPRDPNLPDLDRRKASRTPGKGRTGREEWT
jgi:hypothetical protein